MKTQTLPSGAELKITLAPFEDAKVLLQAITEELRNVKVEFNTSIDVDLFKNLFCVGFSSKKIENALWKCMDRCTYKGIKISKDTFEPEEARADYLDVCIAVAMENVLPFTKTLMQSYSRFLGQMTPKNPA